MRISSLVCHGLLFSTLFLFSTSNAHAAIVLVEFEGTVGSVDSALSGTFSVGDTLRGKYTFESTTPPRAGSTSNFAVFDALTGLKFMTNSYSASSTAAPEIQVDNAPGAPNDRYGVLSRASEGLTGPNVNGLALNFFSFRLDDSTNSVFSDALNLPTNVSLADFDSGSFFIVFEGVRGEDGECEFVTDQEEQTEFVVSGRMTDVRVVPEPASMLVWLGVAGVGFATTARRARRRRRTADS